MKIAVWVPLGMDVQSTLTFGRSDAQVLISGAFCVQFYVRFEEKEASSQWCIITHSIQATIQLKINPPANQRIARSLPTPHYFGNPFMPEVSSNDLDHFR